MNDFKEPMDGNPAAALLDRLVDGELSDDEQRQVLVSLEAQPDGWRRCALAFLEAQMWHRELPGLMRTGNDGDTTVVRKSASAKRSHRASWLALAAGLLVAFTLGAIARAVWQGDSPAGNPTMMVAKDTREEGRQIASAPGEVSPADLTPAAWRTLKVSLPGDDGDAEQFVEVPLVEGGETEINSLLAEQTPVLSDAVLQALQEAGHRVEQRRAYYPVMLDDGRQAVLPMDFVELQYTGGWQ